VVEKEGSSSSGMDTERSEVPVSSPNRRAHKESREGNGGGGDRLSKARGEGHGQQWPSAIRCGRQRCCVNKGERRGVGDAALRD
jgi:hypothetical protein